MAEDIAVLVTFDGRSEQIRMPLQASVGDLRDAIARRCGVARGDQWIGGLPAAAVDDTPVCAVLCDGDRLSLTSSAAMMTQQTLADAQQPPAAAAAPLGAAAAAPPLHVQLREMATALPRRGSDTLLVDEAAAAVRRSVPGVGQDSFEAAASDARRRPALLLAVLYDASAAESAALLLQLADEGPSSAGAAVRASGAAVWLCEAAEAVRLQSLAGLLSNNAALAASVAAVFSGPASLPLCLLLVPEAGALKATAALPAASPEAVAAAVTAASAAHGQRLATLREVLHAESEADALRREQDEALAVAQAADAAQARLQEQAKDEERRRAAAVTEARRAEWAARRAAVQRGLEREAALRGRPEPAAGLRVSFKLPDGTAAADRLLPTDSTVAALFELLDATPACRRVWRDCDSCTLALAYPRIRLCLAEHGHTTLAAAGLTGGRVAFFVDGDRMPEHTAEELQRIKRAAFEAKDFQTCKAVQQRLEELRR